MLVIHKQNLAKLVNYGFRQKGDKIYRLILIRGKYLGEVYVCTTRKKNVYELRFKTLKASPIPDFVYQMFCEKIIEFKVGG